MKKHLFNRNFKGSGGVNRWNARLLDAVNYSKYGAGTSRSVFNAMSYNFEESNQFKKWYTIESKQFKKWYTIAKGTIHEAEWVNKVYYDKHHVQLCIKLLPWLRSYAFQMIPMHQYPFEKRYIIPHASECRLIYGRKIVDSGLVDKVKKGKY